MRVIEMPNLERFINEGPIYQKQLEPILERLDKLERENTILKNKIRRMQR